MRSTVLKNLNFPGQNWRTFFNLISSIAQIRFYNTIGKCQINFIVQAMDMRKQWRFYAPQGPNGLFQSNAVHPISEDGLRI